MSLGASSPAHGACRVTPPRSRKPGPDSGPRHEKGPWHKHIPGSLWGPLKNRFGKTPLCLFAFQPVLIVLLEKGTSQMFSVANTPAGKVSPNSHFSAARGTFPLPPGSPKPGSLSSSCKNNICSSARSIFPPEIPFFNPSFHFPDRICFVVTGQYIYHALLLSLFWRS